MGYLKGEMRRAHLLGTAAPLLLLMMPATAYGQTGGMEDQAAGTNAIVVTARRQDETLQDVPLTVNAITSDTIEKLNIREFSDITAVVPGLTLSGNSGTTTSSTIRGVDFNNAVSGNNGTIEFYYNDAPMTSIVVYQSMFDLGQIEVLRGPQGTLRGRASPSGAITVAARKPDLYEAGGYVMGTATDLGGWNTNFAINLPLITDKLGVRIAGLAKRDELDRVEALGGGAKPESKTQSIRVTARLDPFDGVLVLDGSYQGLDASAVRHDQVQSISELIPTEAPSPVTISARDRLGVRGLAREYDQDFQLFTWQGQLSLWQQQLTYVGSDLSLNIRNKNVEDNAGIFASPYDPAGNEFSRTTMNESRYTSHEVRLQNTDRIFGVFNYIVGGLNYKVDTPTLQDRVGAAFATLTPAPSLQRIVRTSLLRYNSSEETSFFGNLTAHIGDRLELSGGIRHIKYKQDSGVIVGGVEVASIRRSIDVSAEIYSASAKYNLTDDIMAYASFGTSWRPGVSVVGGPNEPTPEQVAFLNLPAETSKSYEAGIKSSWLNDRLKVNLTVYRQNFDNYPYRIGGEGVYAIDVAAGSVAPFNYVAPVPVRVTGVEAEINARVTPDWTISSFLSYADGQIKDGTVPCTDLDNDGIPDTLSRAPTFAELSGAVGSAGIGTCQVNIRSNSASPFSASVQTEYGVDLSNRVRGFARALYAFNGSSRGDPVNPYDGYGAHGILNLYAGVRDPDGAWDLTLYAKNLFNEFKVLSRTNGPLTTVLRSPGTQSYTNYFGITTTPLREFGVTLRVSLGSG